MHEHAATHDDDNSTNNNITDILPASGATYMAQAVINSAEQYMMEDIKINKTIGNFGADVVFQCVDCEASLSNLPIVLEQALNILTYCNTGLGLVEVGVIQSIHKRQRLSTAFAMETKLHNQGG